MATVSVASFTAKWSDWNISWPWSASIGNTSTIQLPVTFTVELGEGAKNSDCFIGQKMRGSSRNGKSRNVFRDWSGDGATGGGLWWDGKNSLGAKLSWDSAGRVATFRDHPGFDGAPGGDSLYMGDADEGAGYFGFQTFVKDSSSLTVVKQIEWYMRIDVPTPGKGGRWWSFVK